MCEPRYEHEEALAATVAAQEEAVAVLKDALVSSQVGLIFLPLLISM